ncbi:MAG TPA: tetratricopeptide repeat protein [Symbiobacteriaceae bacterium]|jgi:Flp pilus assembly protein TadD
MKRILAPVLLATLLLGACRQGTGAPVNPPGQATPSGGAVPEATPIAHPAPYDQAQVQLKAGNFPAAVDLLKAAVSGDPQNARAYNDLCFAYIRLQSWPEAVAAGEAALRLDPSIPGAKFNAGRAYLGAKQYSQAQDNLLSAYRKDEQNQDIAWYLGLAYEGNQKLPAALARKHWPANPGTRNSRRPSSDSMRPSPPSGK